MQCCIWQEKTTQVLLSRHFLCTLSRYHTTSKWYKMSNWMVTLTFLTALTYCHLVSLSTTFKVKLNKQPKQTQNKNKINMLTKMFWFSRKAYMTTQCKLNYVNYNMMHKVLVTLYTDAWADLLIRLLIRAEQMSLPSRTKFLKFICCSWFWKSCNKQCLFCNSVWNWHDLQCSMKYGTTLHNSTRKATHAVNVGIPVTIPSHSNRTT